MNLKHFMLTSFAAAALGCGASSSNNATTDSGGSTGSADTSGTTTANPDSGGTTGTADSGGTGLPPGCEVEPTLASIESAYFVKSCALSASCHKGPVGGGQLVLEAGKSYDSLVGVDAVRAKGKKRVVPGDPDASFLMQKVLGTMDVTEGTLMPQGAVDPVDPECRIQAVRLWIAAGAKK